MVSWSVIQSAILFLGPILWPRLRSFYHTIQHPPHPPRPVPYTPRLLLNLLFLTASLFLLSTFSIFHPENIVTRTSSRLLQTSTDVIFTRLYSQRSSSPSDSLLRKRLTSRSGRLLYSLYGPGPLSNCVWCHPDVPETFLFYALPTILFPHLIHIAVLGLVTTRQVFRGDNKAGAVWRTQATLAGVALAVSEVYYISTYSHTTNISARTAAANVYPYWAILTYRGLAIALVDAALGYAIYLTATGRWGSLISDSPAEKIDAVSAALEDVIRNTNSALSLKQAVMTDADLRRQVVDFWEKEGLTRRELAEAEGVRLARRAVERRRDWATICSDARQRARAFSRSLFVKRPVAEPQPQPHPQPKSSHDTTTPLPLPSAASASAATPTPTPASSGYFETGQGDEFVASQKDELDVGGQAS